MKEASEKAAALLSGRYRKSKRLVFDPPIEIVKNGEIERTISTIDVAQVSMGARARLRQLAHDAKNAKEMMNADIACVIEAALDEDGKRLFDASHRDTLIEQPAGDWIDRVAREAAVLMRGPLGGRCAAQKTTPKLDADKHVVLDDDGQVVMEGVVDADGKPVQCGCELVPGEEYCPRCGTKGPGALEIARGN